MTVTLTEPSIIRSSLLQAPNYKDTCLWLIDDSPSMHRLDPELGISYVHRSLEVAMKMMEQKLVTNPSDRVGILFFNDSKSPGRILCILGIIACVIGLRWIA